MDKEAVESMHETMQSAGRLADSANCPHMERDLVKCRGITLLSHNMKFLEMLLDKSRDNRLRESIASEKDDGPLM